MLLLHLRRPFFSRRRCASSVVRCAMWRRIEERYGRALRNGAVFKTPTKVTRLRDDVSGTDFAIRLSEALQKKPKAKSKKREGNPFLPYDPELWVADPSESHALLLNKFNLVDRHVLVVTRQFEEQEAPLTLADVAATWTVLTCMPEGGVAFFNCGPFSGASQPHKHTQVVPLPLAPSLALPLDAYYKSALAKRQTPLLELPFVAYGVTLEDGIEPRGIWEAYQRLMTASEEWLRNEGASYNVVWTRDWFILVPRSKEKHGPCSLNSLAFAGTMFIRSEAELEHMEQTGPMRLLQEVGFPRT